jgi:rare lipoprotein A
MNQRHFWNIVALSIIFVPSVASAQTTSASKQPLTNDVVKVGEYKSSTGNLPSGAELAEIYPHTVTGRQGATLYVRSIPVLTFVGSTPVTTEETKVGEIASNRQQQSPNPNDSDIAKLGNATSVGDISTQEGNDDPIQRASLVAAKINQLALQNLDATQITVSWQEAVPTQAQNKASTQDPNSESYMIKVNGTELVEIDNRTRLADTTNNLAQDALQATNRLRRLLGNAAPLNEITNLPKPISLPIPKLPQLPEKIAIAPVRLTIRGMASFYGYDGSGNRTATGERFNPEGMTAAHRSLPFGTRVRVTNTRNGRSVVVRINDRGPFIRGRVIDLSFGAARVLRMLGSGVAPVRVEVLR